MKKSRLYRNDVLLAAAIIVVALLVYAMVGRQKASNHSLVVTVDGVVVDTLPLDRDGEYHYLQDTYILLVKDGTAKVIQSSCPDSTCMRMKVGSRGGEIVCLPNRVRIALQDKQDGVDLRVG